MLAWPDPSSDSSRAEEMDRSAIRRTGFLLSLAALAFLGGYLTRDFTWFPHDFLQRAVAQGERVLTDRSRAPDFTEVRASVDSPESGEEASPDTLDPSDATTAAADLDPALTLITSTWEREDGEWTPGVRLVDREGRVVHEWWIEPTEVFADSVHRRGTGLDEQDLQGTALLPGGDLVANVEYAGTVRVDACSRVEWTLAEGSHHSIERAEDGTLWIPGITHEGPARSERYPRGFVGLASEIYRSQVLHVGPGGRLLRRIDVLSLLYDSGLERFIPKNRQQDEEDVVHLNDVEPLPGSMADAYPLFEAGDLLLSLRNLDLVLVVDPDTREVKWSASRPFIMQHDPDFLGRGWIGVFDNNWDDTNNGTMLGGSRIVALNPGSDSTRVLFPTAASEHFYTAHRGKWQQLENGNRLLTEADRGRILEVAPDGRTVWSWSVEAYSDDRVPSVTRGHRVDLTREEAAAWPCSPGDSAAAPN